MKTALTIAGSDTIGGAGIQADIKTMMAHGVYAMSAITALTAQNTLGVTGVLDVPPEFLAQEIDAVFTDIRPDATKIGMVSNAQLIETIAERLKFYKAEKVVVDPVMVATSGADLMRTNAVSALKAHLFELATLITPNIPESEVLCGFAIKTQDDMIEAAKRINGEFGCAVLVKGGHCVNDANDLLCQRGETTWFNAKRIDNPNTHGTGCTLSSAIASNLAKGCDLADSIQKAKEYLSMALAAMLDLGKGSGPLNHNHHKMA